MIQHWLKHIIHKDIIRLKKPEMIYIIQLQRVWCAFLAKSLREGP